MVCVPWRKTQAVISAMSATSPTGGAAPHPGNAHSDCSQYRCGLEWDGVLGARREGPRENGAALRTVCGGKVAAMRLQDAPRDGKSKACAAGLPVARGLAAVQWSEEPWEVLRRNA
jgi:hypothetical protein